MTANPTAEQLADAPKVELTGKIPAWAQILVIIALWPVVKAIPGIPFSGQLYIFIVLIISTFFVRGDGQTWRDLGLRWATSWKGYAKGVGMIVVTFIAVVAANAAVQYAIVEITGAPVEREFYDVSTLPLYLTMMVLVWTTNAVGEELVFRGFMMSRFAVVFGGSRFAWVIAAFAQALLFGTGHAAQGIHGVIITSCAGLVFGLLYLVAQRNLWPLIIAHGIINSIGMTIVHLQSTGVISLEQPIG